MNTVIKFIKWLREGVIISLFFVCAVRGQIARWFVRRAKTIFADDFSAAEIILLAKNGQAKIASRNFFARRFFRDHKSGPKNAVNFLDHDGAKKGCNPSSPQERFTFVRRAAMSKVQKRYSLPKSNRNSLLDPDFRLLFLRLFLIDNSDAG